MPCKVIGEVTCRTRRTRYAAMPASGDGFDEQAGDGQARALGGSAGSRTAASPPRSVSFPAASRARPSHSDGSGTPPARPLPE
jgi:hypothetical protein